MIYTRPFKQSYYLQIINSPSDWISLELPNLEITSAPLNELLSIANATIETIPYQGIFKEAAVSQFPPHGKYYIYDHLGNTRVVYHIECTTGGGSQVQGFKFVVDQAIDYYAFGKILREFIATPTVKYKSTQHERDQETGLDYRIARYYDSEIMRFLSVDPKDENFPQSTPYNYTLNNPINLFDLDGAAPESPQNEYVRYRNAQGEWITKEVSKIGGNGYDIIHTYNGKIPDLGSSITSKISFNNNYGYRLDPGIFVGGYEAPLDFYDFSDFIPEKIGAKITLKAGLGIFFKKTSQDVVEKGSEKIIFKESAEVGFEKLAKPGKFKPGNNQVQNEQFKSLSKKYGLTQKEQDILHRELREERLDLDYKGLEEHIKQNYKNE